MKKIVYLLSVSFVFLSASIVSAQSIHIKKAIGKIKLDALIDEPDWQSAEVADNFQQYFPTDTAKAKSKTEVRMTYDDQFIYISAKMYNLKNTREYVTPSLRRDFRGEGNDGITFVFDTFKDRTNGFIFGVNPFGVQREGLVSNGGDDFS
ncbi:MAG: carbohydrate binding family 9 domain-containing protein, partial [Chryseotalea sp.]